MKNLVFFSTGYLSILSHLFIYSITYFYYYTRTDIYHQCNVILLLRVYLLILHQHYLAFIVFLH